MAFRIIRQRKEARRNAKLEEIFEDRDKSGSGHINYDQLEEIYRVYQVELDDSKASRIQDKSGLISREDFMIFAKDTHLLDFECSAMGEAILLLSPRKSSKHPTTPKKSQNPHQQSQRNKPGEHQESETSCAMLACFCTDKKVEELLEDRMDKVEFAFRKFDIDGDGYLSWEEFQQVFVFNTEKNKTFKSLTLACKEFGPRTSIENV